MALKQKKDGGWVIQSGKDLEAAVQAVEDRLEAISEAEQAMEEKYDYLTMKDEVASLNEAIRVFMVETQHKHVFRDQYKLTLIRRSNTKWNPDKLKKLVPKNIWLRVTNQVPDPGKIDDAVREGVLDSKVIAPALEVTPVKPHVQRYDYKEGQSKDDAIAEEAALRAAMSAEAVAAVGSPEKRGKRK